MQLHTSIYFRHYNILLWKFFSGSKCTSIGPGHLNITFRSDMPITFFISEFTHKHQMEQCDRYIRSECDVQRTITSKQVLHIPSRSSWKFRRLRLEEYLGISNICYLILVLLGLLLPIFSVLFLSLVDSCALYLPALGIVKDRFQRRSDDQSVISSK